MKRIWVVLGLIAFLLLVAYLYNIGVINISWQAISAILAGLAGPFAFLQKHLNLGRRKTNKVEQLNARQDQLYEQTQILKAQYEAEIRKRELKIQQLQAQLEKLQDQLDELKLEKSHIDSEVQHMSISEKQKQFTQYFGS